MADPVVNLHTRITMLGATGTGKTCFMLGMYAIMRDGVEGFTFSTDMDADLKLDSTYNQLLEDDWPQGNNAMPAYYKFQFNYGFRRIISFDWMDYRGGALADVSTEEDVQALIKHMFESNCVLICVTGQSLFNDRQAKKDSRIDRINGFLQQLRDHVESEKGQLPAIVIVITKYDYCADPQTGEITDQIQHKTVDQVRRLFTPLFAPGAGWLVTISPVTMGAKLKDKIDGHSVAPENVHHPVTFAAYRLVQQETDRLQSETVSYRRRAEEDRSELQTQEQLRDMHSASLISRLWNQKKLSEEESKIRDYKQRIEEALSSANRTEEVKIKLLASMRLLLSKLMEGMPIFLDGEEVEFDID